MNLLKTQLTQKNYLPISAYYTFEIFCSAVYKVTN